jgi:type I restriction enzyme R subunit
MSRLVESDVEQAALAWFESLGYTVKAGPDLAPDGSTPERGSYAEVVLHDRLRQALAWLNPTLPAEALEDAFRRLTSPEGATLEARNRAFHRMLTDGVTVEYRRPGGAIAGAQVRVLDFEETSKNDWLVVNQLPVAEQKHARRLDVVVFVDGLPLALIELKNAAAENATIWTAFQQLQTYKGELTTLFSCNEVLDVSDGVEARIGTLTASREWFKPWRTISGEALADTHLSELQVMIEGVFHKGRFEDYQKWLQATSLQAFLFDEADASIHRSRTSRERFWVLKEFDEACKQRKLGVRLSTRRGLWTPRPPNPINFWMYEPQHPEDKAPQEGKRSV